ncbi:MAG: Rho termination factor N-terminal domain-containing protein, partial [Planctomycetota bacterium]
MAKQNELAGKTLKELRQLAGQHQIKNRSRLAKKDLIEALSQVAAAGERPAQEAPTARPAPPPKPDAPTRASTPADEPEVLDAAAVARITGAADEAAPPERDPLERGRRVSPT